MIVGVPKEIKTDEYRVAMIPVGVEELTRKGHRVLIQSGAGQGSGISDEAYASNGAEILPDLSAIWKSADLIVKVKEPLCEEWPLLRSGQMVFTYFHFAADEKLTQAVMKSGATAIAYETIKDARGNLPLLTPMSEVAGRMSIQEGAKFLERPFEGRGILLGGVPGVLPANVVILGGGVVGANAAKVAAGLGAQVMILDVNLDRLRYLDDVMPRNVTTLFSDRHNILDCLGRTDLLIGSVLIPGARAPGSSCAKTSSACRPAPSLLTWRSTKGAASKPPGQRPTAIRRTWWTTWCTIASRTCPAPWDERVPMRCATSRSRTCFSWSRRAWTGRCPRMQASPKE